MGNGHDTLFLAELVGESGHVHSFDVQEAALAATRRRLMSAGIDAGRYTLRQEDHARLLTALPEQDIGRVAAVMFNLGYLPGGDHSVITTQSSTLPALEGAAAALRIGGVVTAVLYPGHEGGAQEAAAVQRWAEGLPQHTYQAVTYRFLNQRNAPPYVVAIEKRSG